MSHNKALSWLQALTDCVYTSPRRILTLSDKKFAYGESDIEGLGNIEVIIRPKANIDVWWQSVEHRLDSGKLFVLMSKGRRTPWNIWINGEITNNNSTTIVFPAKIIPSDFKAIFINFLEETRDA